MHAMSIDDTYRVEQVLARGEDGITELVTIDGAGPFARKKMRQELARRNVWSALTECGLPCPESGEQCSGADRQTGGVKRQGQPQKPKAVSGESKLQVPGRLLFRTFLACAIIAGLLTVSGIAISSFQAAREKSSSPASSSQTGQSSNASTSDKANAASDSGHWTAELSIVESGWSASKSGYVHFGIGLKNSDGSAAIAFPTVKIYGYDANGRGRQC